jgi:hypothetical protein
MPQRYRGDRTRKALAIVALLGGLGIFATIVGGVVMQIFGDAPRQTMPVRDVPRTSQPAVAPGPLIRPLPVRAVQDVRPVAPEECPADQTMAVPAAEILSMCDFTRTAAYTLGPQVLELQLSSVDTLKPLNSESHVVRLTMQPASATALAAFTADHVGDQLAFVRNRVVVFAPKITQPLNAQGLEISGNMTAEQAGDIARLLGETA